MFVIGRDGDIGQKFFKEQSTVELLQDQIIALRKQVERLHNIVDDQRALIKELSQYIMTK